MARRVKGHDIGQRCFDDDSNAWKRGVARIQKAAGLLPVVVHARQERQAPCPKHPRMHNYAFQEYLLKREFLESYANRDPTNP
eukprot:1105976-Amphidinium_carterae.1